MNSDRVWRLALLSLAMNLAFAVYHGVLGLLSYSWWFITLSVYYFVLTAMRFAVWQIQRRSAGDTATERFAKRFSGGAFILLSVSLLGTVILSVVTDRGVKYHEIAMIAIAVYAFTKVTMAIINLVKARRHDSPALQTLRSISFADALVSIASLQRSMLVSFDGMAERNIRLLNVLTGSAVCLAVCLLGIHLIGGRWIDVARSKIAKANETIAETVVGGYKKIENAVVSGYTKLEDKFVDAYLTKEGETVEDAKERLKNENR